MTSQMYNLLIFRVWKAKYTHNYLFVYGAWPMGRAFYDLYFAPAPLVKHYLFISNMPRFRLVVVVVGEKKTTKNRRQYWPPKLRA